MRNKQRTDGTISPLSAIAVRGPIDGAAAIVAWSLGIGLAFAWLPMLPIMFGVLLVFYMWLNHKEPRGCPFCTKRVRYGASICRWCHSSLTWQWKRDNPAETARLSQ